MHGVCANNKGGHHHDCQHGQHGIQAQGAATAHTGWQGRVLNELIGALEIGRLVPVRMGQSCHQSVAVHAFEPLLGKRDVLVDVGLAHAPRHAAAQLATKGVTKGICITLHDRLETNHLHIFEKNLTNRK